MSKFEIWYGICHRKPRKNCIPHPRKSVTVLGIPCPFEPIHTHRSAFEVPFKECSLQTSSACRFVREPAQVRGSKKGISSCLRLPTLPLASKEFLGCWQTADCGSVLHFFWVEAARMKHCLTFCQPNHGQPKSSKGQRQVLNPTKFVLFGNVKILKVLKAGTYIDQFHGISTLIETKRDELNEPR